MIDWPAFGTLGNRSVGTWFRAVDGNGPADPKGAGCVTLWRINYGGE